MNKRKHEPKPLMTARFLAQARLALAKRSDHQGRLLAVAAEAGAQLEPTGRMAG